MANQMTIKGLEVPIGSMVMTFRRFGDDSPPYSCIDVMPDQEDESRAGLALNCLDVGDVESMHALDGRDFSFGEGSDTEIRESVLWGPNKRMLEIQSLRIKFGAVAERQSAFDLQARCFDHFGETDIDVVVTGTARIVRE